MLSVATLRNRKDLAGYCLEQGARLDTNDIYDTHRSITGSSFTTHKFLVAKGLDINYNVEYMGDILTTAVDRNHLAWVRFCLENGADPNLNLYLDTYSPLAHAARIKWSWRLSSYRATWEAGYGQIPRKGAFDDENCETGSLETDEQDEQGTALHLVKKGPVDILKYLPESGANRNLTDHRVRKTLEKFLEIKDMKLVEELKDALSKARPNRATLVYLEPLR